MHKPLTTSIFSLVRTKVKEILPQVYFQISDGAINALDDTSRWITAPHYDVGEIWDVQNVMEEVNKVLGLAKAAFEKRMVLLC